MIPDAVLEEFTANLIPEAFERPTRARRVAVEDRGGGVEGFDAWAVDRLADALDARWPLGGRPRAVGALSDGRLRWWFDECGCGHLYCVTDALADEVWEVEEPWVFGAVLARPEGAWEVLLDEDGNEVDEVWRQPTDLRWQAAWYAEGRGRGVARRRTGLVQLQGEQVTAHDALEVRGSWVTRDLHRLLYRHPSRKRFPLRRGRR